MRRFDPVPALVILFMILITLAVAAVAIHNIWEY